MKRLLATIMSCAFFVLPQIVCAEGLACLRATVGGRVRWDADWQKDHLDNNRLYNVDNIRETTGEGGMRVVELNLSAVGDASVPQRTANIRKDHAAEMFCDRVSHSSNQLTAVISSGGKMFAPTEGGDNVLDPHTLPFRTRIEGRWVPAKALPGESRQLCQTRTAIFACPSGDAAALERDPNEREDSERPLGRRKLKQPLIRFTSSGWVRADSIGIANDIPISECRVMNRSFSCLTEEKDRYWRMLKKLEDVYAAQSND